MRVWKSSLATVSPIGLMRRHLPNAVAVLVFSMAAVVSSAQTYTVLYNFQGFPGGGGNPVTAMFQATDGDLYGTTSSGGMLNAVGTLFKTTPSGALTTLYDFCNTLPCTDGDVPSSLLQAADGNIYGLTTYGGAGKCACGTFFQLTSSGIITLASFKQVNGADPIGELIQATDGNFYGTAAALGLDHYGTVFKVTSSGALTAIHTFCSESGCSDGADPYGGLLQATNQMLYGTTPGGGLYGGGTVFQITTGGKFTTLYNFCASGGTCSDGNYSAATLVQGADGYLYGTTTYGGNSTCQSGCGTVFQISMTGALTTLHAFNGTDGAAPVAGLVQGSDGNFYGTTSSGGPNSMGTVFKITPGGTLTTLYNFCSQTNCADGAAPQATLVQDTNGMFYGTNYAGGPYDYGTLFSLSVGLRPFVATRPSLGQVGTTVNILGSNLTAATGVTFNGTPATFTVNSKTWITATVPSGATTGRVQVSTPSGTLSSNVSFHVLP